MFKRVLVIMILVLFIGAPIVFCKAGRNKNEVDIMNLPDQQNKVSTIMQGTDMAEPNLEDIYNHKSNELVVKQEELKLIDDKNLRFNKVMDKYKIK